jgi:hypothetical protein
MLGSLQIPTVHLIFTNVQGRDFGISAWCKKGIHGCVLTSDEGPDSEFREYDGVKTHQCKP